MKSYLTHNALYKTPLEGEEANATVNRSSKQDSRVERATNLSASDVDLSCSVD